MFQSNQLNQLNNENILAAQRYMLLKQMEEQRRIRYLHKTLGNDAATKYKRLKMARRTAILASALSGGLLGAGIGYASADDYKGGGALMGGLLGAGLGGVAGGIGDIVGNMVGTYQDSSKAALRRRLTGMNEFDYIAPGRAAALDAQLEKEFLENETQSAGPRQHVF